MLAICQGTEVSEFLLNGTGGGLDPVRLLVAEWGLLENEVKNGVLLLNCILPQRPGLNVPDRHSFLLHKRGPFARHV